MRGPTKNVGPIGLVVFWIQTDKQSIYTEKMRLVSNFLQMIALIFNVEQRIVIIEMLALL